MRKSLHRLALMAVAVAALTLLGAVGTVRAQCTSVNVTNTSTCNVRVTLYDGFGNTVAINSFAGPGITNFGLAPLAGNPLGTVSNAGTQFPFVPNGLGISCTSCFRCPTIDSNGNLDGGTCCITVCFDAVRCGMSISGCNVNCSP